MGRRGFGSYVAIPHAVLNSEALTALSAPAAKLLLDLAAQYKGENNGDLQAAWKLMQRRGWKSRDTLGKALAELQRRGLIEKTRQGGRHRCSLYALSWQPIHECKGKLDVPATRVASGLWKRNGSGAIDKTLARPACQLGTAGVSIDGHGKRIDTAGVSVDAFSEAA